MFYDVILSVTADYRVSYIGESNGLLRWPTRLYF